MMLDGALVDDEQLSVSLVLLEPLSWLVFDSRSPEDYPCYPSLAPTFCRQWNFERTRDCCV